MKKILIILWFILLLYSCWQEQNIDNEKKHSIKNDINIENKNINNSEKWNNTYFSDLHKNIDKLKEVNLSNEDLEEINSFLLGFYNDKLLNKAVNNKNLLDCDWLDNYYKNECKKKIIIEKWDLKSCDELKSEEENLYCKNEIFIKKAIEKLDLKECNNIENKEFKEECIFTVKEEINNKNNK